MFQRLVLKTSSSEPKTISQNFFRLYVMHLGLIVGQLILIYCEQKPLKPH